MTPTKILRTLVAGGIAAATVGSGSLLAGDYGKAIINDKVPIEAWQPCDIFDKKYFYKGDGFVKSARFLGRYQGQMISQQEDVDGNFDNGFHRWQHRRFRLGFEVEFANNLSFYIESNIADGIPLTNDYFITDHQDLHIKWEPDHYVDPKAPVNGFRLNWVQIGKQKQHITREDITSSKRIKTVERSPIVNEMAGARPWGIVAEFQTGILTHEIGGWLYGGHQNEPSFLDTGSRGGFSYNITYPLNDATSLHFDYVYADNDGGFAPDFDAAESFGPAYEHALAAGVSVESGRFQLISDFIYAANRSASGRIPVGNDTWGFYVLPSYDITDKLEAVFKYAYMDEGREQRTARFNVRQRVENYHTLYAGLQYFICGENLKLMAGYEYNTGDIFATPGTVDTSSWMFAVRTYW